MRKQSMRDEHNLLTLTVVSQVPPQPPRARLQARHVRGIRPALVIPIPSDECVVDHVVRKRLPQLLRPDARIAGHVPRLLRVRERADPHAARDLGCKGGECGTDGAAHGRGAEERDGGVGREYLAEVRALHVDAVRRQVRITDVVAVRSDLVVALGVAHEMQSLWRHYIRRWRVAMLRRNWAGETVDATNEGGFMRSGARQELVVLSSPYVSSLYQSRHNSRYVTPQPLRWSLSSGPTLHALLAALLRQASRLQHQCIGCGSWMELSHADIFFVVLENCWRHEPLLYSCYITRMTS